MYCKVCGTHENLSFHQPSGLTLCRYCAAEMPAEPKLSRSEFYAQYFGDDHGCPDAIKREFYSDYQTSTLTFAQYVERTTSNY